MSAVVAPSVSPEALAARLVRFEDLRPCTTAFIDARTPGSDRKENFTIIGPGVAENPDQHVHISIPHGFNIGGARQPPHCVNSQHSHATAEVFVVHSGTWAFRLGERGTDAEIIIRPGDTISIPTGVFRGFENVGADTGFLFSVLGGDDPGHVTWAPDVFAMAKDYGLVLLESGRLIDTARGERVPTGLKPQAPPSIAVVAGMRRMTAAEIAACVAPTDSLARTASGGLNGPGVTEAPIIGGAAEGLPAGKMAWPHGFHVRRLDLAPAAVTPRHVRREEEVLLVHQGNLDFIWDGGKLALGAGDTFTVPTTLARQFANRGPGPAVAYVVRGGDRPAAAQIIG